MQASAFSKRPIGGNLKRMKQLFDSEKFKRMIFFILAVIFLIGLLSLMSRVGSETLTDYAEKNPEADIEGYDACRKIAILSSLMCGKFVKYENIYTEGISAITAKDFKYAHAIGCSIKLLAVSKETDDGYFAMVAPFMIGREHPLHMVRGVYNAVFVHGNTLGDSMYYGAGAGKLPTASAVVGDVVDAAKHLGKTVVCLWSEEEAKLTGIEKYRCKYFVRVKAENAAKAKEAFKISEIIDPGFNEEFAFITDVIDNKEYEEAAAKTGSVITRIRMA